MVKTLIINGSPRKNGDTVQLIRKLKEKIPGEVVEFVCYQSDIKGCVDCRYCWEHDGCCRKDGWQELEQVIQECDNLLIASPVYFLNCRVSCWIFSAVYSPSGVPGIIGRQN